MIEALALRNFQSHKKTILKFHPNVNAIVGTSNSGKTAILRGLLWAIYNRPSGMAFVSYWNRDGKGNPEKPTTVSIRTKNSDIARIRSKELNGYEIDNRETDKQTTLEAVGMDVPEQVTALLNISEVNIQRQMDAPFLLSESASEVARFLNREIRLDVIDRIFSAAESRRRKYNQEIKQYSNDIASIEREMETFSILDQAVRYNTQLKAVEEQADGIENGIEGLKVLYSDYEKYDGIINRYRKIRFKEIDFIIAELEAGKGDQKKISDRIEGLRALASDYENNARTVTESGKELARLEKSMPDTCPLCGGKIC